MTLQDNMSAGQVVVYSGYHGIWLWRPGNCTVLILNEEGVEYEVFTWCDEPKSIEDCISMCKDKAERMDSEAEEDQYLFQHMGGNVVPWEILQ